MRIGSDTGGTFTDLVTADGAVAKVPSTRDDPGRAVRDGIAAMADGPDGNMVLVHGTTVATNALLERRLARVVLVTSEGMVDVIEIARQDRPSLYDPSVRRPQPLVHRRDRLGVPGRIGPDGVELVPIDLEVLADLGEGVDCVAVCLLHADLNPTHEESVVAALNERGFDVCASHQVSPEFREYERTVTTVVNAALRPLLRSYLGSLAESVGEVLVMTSAGGLLPAGVAAELPAALLLSGPAGGVRAAAAVAKAHGFADAVTIDMGGTSTDVCLIL